MRAAIRRFSSDVSGCLKRALDGIVFVAESRWRGRLWQDWGRPGRGDGGEQGDQDARTTISEGQMVEVLGSGFMESSDNRVSGVRRRQRKGKLDPKETGFRIEDGVASGKTGHKTHGAAYKRSIAHKHPCV